MEPETGENSEFTAHAAFDGERRSVQHFCAESPFTLHQPLAGPVHGTVFLIPGWSGPRTGPAEILTWLATQLARNGWQAIRLDMPARGDADGNPTQSGLDEMISTLRNSLGEKLDGRVAFLGMCSGGNVALGALPAVPDSVRAIAISTFPFQRSRSKDMDKRRRWKNLKNYASKAFSPSTWARLLRGEINVDRVKKNLNASDAKVSGARNLKDSTRDIEAELCGWKGRALFVWGGGDEEAPPSRTHFEKLHADGMGQNCEFVTVAGANHNFYGQAWREELFARISSFLKQ